MGFVMYLVIYKENYPIEKKHFSKKNNLYTYI